MTDHVICVRNVKKDKFGSEPGATYFLARIEPENPPTPQGGQEKGLV